MDEIFIVYEPGTVKELIEEMFTGYINSPMCAVGYLGDMYELKKLIASEADKYMKDKKTKKAVKELNEPTAAHIAKKMKEL